MDHHITTDLDVPTTCKAIDKAFEEQQVKFPQYKPAFLWEGELVEGQPRTGKFSFKPTPSMDIAGSLEVSTGKVLLKFGKLPFVVSMFKGKAISIVEKEVQIWVAKAKAGEI